MWVTIVQMFSVVMLGGVMGKGGLMFSGPHSLDSCTKCYPDLVSSTHNIQEEGVELVSLIKATNLYRRSKPRNVVTDYIPPSQDEMDVLRKVHLKCVICLFLSRLVYIKWAHMHIFSSHLGS